MMETFDSQRAFLTVFDVFSLNSVTKTLRYSPAKDLSPTHSMISSEWGIFMSDKGYLAERFIIDRDTARKVFE